MLGEEWAQCLCLSYSEIAVRTFRSECDLHRAEVNKGIPNSLKYRGVFEEERVLVRVNVLLNPCKREIFCGKICSQCMFCKLLYKVQVYS
jgi:hypothetical protein